MAELSEPPEAFPLMKFAERTASRDEVLRRVGRNLMHFQKLEQLLKVLLPVRSFEVSLAQADKDMQSHIDGFAAKTLGTLVTELKEGPNDKSSKRSEAVGASASFRFQSELPWSSGAQKQACETALTALTKSRNELVHHFLPYWQAACEGDESKALSFFDHQCEETLHLINALMEVGLRFDDLSQSLAAHIASPEFDEQFEEAWRNGAPVVQRLREVAVSLQDRDGWVVLDRAVAQLRGEDADLLVDLRARYGHSKLGDLLRTIGDFELSEVATARGGSRAMYRVKALG